MSFKRPPTEDKFVNDYLRREIHALGVNLSLQEKFIQFAVDQGGADPRKFPPRLYHVIKGRAPSAFIAILIVKFFSERWHEDFHRVTIDHVEYLTSSRDTSEFERFVATHPLSLRIVQVQAIDWVVTGRPQSVDIRLRTQVACVPPENQEESEEVEWFNQKFEEFQNWLSSKGEMPQSIRISENMEIPIRYYPDWAITHDLDEYQWRSDLSGDVDTVEGIILLRYCEYGSGSPDVPEGLDICYRLHKLFVGTEVSPAPAELTFSNYWQRIVEGQSAFVEIYFAHINKFPKTVRCNLDPYFNAFAKRHRRWVAKANADFKIREEQGDDFVPTPEDVEHYSHVMRVFFEDLELVLEKCWADFAIVAQEIHEIERMRANDHFSKMKNLLNLE